MHAFVAHKYTGKRRETRCSAALQRACRRLPAELLQQSYYKGNLPCCQEWRAEKERRPARGHAGRPARLHRQQTALIAVNIVGVSPEDQAAGSAAALVQIPRQQKLNFLQGDILGFAAMVGR